MKTKELIQALRECVFENQYKVEGVDVLMFQAADRLEQLEKELEAVKAERDAAVANIPQWINVNDSLPENDSEVLVIANGNPRSNITLFDAYELACYCKEDGWIIEQYVEWEEPEITYWMPLPTPYKDGEQK